MDSRNDRRSENITDKRMLVEGKKQLWMTEIAI